MQKKMNPAGAEAAGLGNAQRAAVRTESNTTKQNTPEDFAAIYLQKRFRLSPCVSRVIAGLAQLGGRL
jgi:hypothetical protein